MVQKEGNQTFDAVVGFGKNWGNRKRPFTTPDGQAFMVSEDTARTAVACGDVYISGRARKILFSTGETRIGAPTEATGMKLQLRSVYSEDEIPDEDIILEESSIDTPGNIESIKEIVEKSGFKEVLGVTVNFHTWRVKRLNHIQGSPISHVVSSEEILRKRGFSLPERSIMKLVKEYTLEAGLLGLSLFDREGRIPRKITQRIRK
jgi:hypothetical protein